MEVSLSRLVREDASIVRLRQVLHSRHADHVVGRILGVLASGADAERERQMLGLLSMWTGAMQGQPPAVQMVYILLNDEARYDQVNSTDSIIEQGVWDETPAMRKIKETSGEQTRAMRMANAPGNGAAGSPWSRLKAVLYQRSASGFRAALHQLQLDGSPDAAHLAQLLASSSPGIRQSVSHPTNAIAVSDTDFITVDPRVVALEAGAPRPLPPRAPVPTSPSPGVRPPPTAVAPPPVAPPPAAPAAEEELFGPGQPTQPTAPAAPPRAPAQVRHPGAPAGRWERFTAGIEVVRQIAAILRIDREMAVALVRLLMELLTILRTEKTGSKTAMLAFGRSEAEYLDAMSAEMSGGRTRAFNMTTDPASDYLGDD